jgi:hypothetical protein
VTERAYKRLRHRFAFESRDPIEVKGKGMMRPYLLVGPMMVNRFTAEEPIVESPNRV